TSLALILSLAGCGGGGSTRTGTAGGKPSRANPPAARSTGQTDSGNAGPAAAGKGSKRTRRGLGRVCRALNSPLPPLPPVSRARPVRAAAQQTVAQLVPLASALGSITAKSGDAALSA